MRLQPPNILALQLVVLTVYSSLDLMLATCLLFSSSEFAKRIK